VLASFALFAGLAVAQDASTLSIEDALRMALGVSDEIAIAEGQVLRSEGGVWQARSEFVPTIGAQAVWQHQFASEYDGLFGGGGASIDLPFGRPDSWRVDFRARQVAFAGGRVHYQTRLARAGLSASRLSEESTRASVVLSTARAYYDAVLGQRLLEIAEVALEHARVGLDVGRTAEFDVLLASAEAEQQKVVVIRARRLRDTSILNLAQMLDLPAEGLQLSSDLDADISAVAAEVAGVGAAGEDKDRLAFQIAEQSVTIAKAGVGVARSPWFPQVSLSGSIGWVSYPENVLPPVDGEAWSDNITVGMVIDLPIFSGGRIWGGLLDARGSLYQAQASLEDTEDMVALDTVDAHLELESALAQYDASVASVAQAERTHEIAQVRFSEGVSTQSELVDARLLEQRAQAALAQSARDLQVARIRVALLPALPVSLSPF